MDRPLIWGFGVANWRGIGSAGVRVGPLARVSFLVGRNNHGKSSVLQAAQFFSNDHRKAEALQEAVRSGREADRPFERFILAEVRAGALRSYGYSSDPADVRRRAQGLFQPDVDDALFCDWVALTADQVARVDASRLDRDHWSGLTGFVPDVFKLAVEALEPGLYARDDDRWGMRVTMIPAFRSLVHVSAADRPVNTERANRGEGLARLVQSWQSPDHRDPGARDDELRFAALQDLLRDVLEDAGAHLHVPHNARTLQVATRQSSMLRDVEDLGDGIVQILMIGAAALSHDETLVCIEEPELHLHAGLQRKLIRHLAAGTSNQYLIATHSTAMLDLPGARVFHVSHNGESIQVSPATSVDDVVRVSEDLGFRASDLLQTNYTVWVEGPSDRIYWRHWLQLVDPTLIEGVHYLLVSYGGRLVDDLRIDGGGEARELTDQEVDQRLDILRLGRWCTLIADSDRASPDDEPGAHHARLRGESEKSRTASYVVLDHVRTVESLIPADLLQRAVRTVHPTKGRDFSKPADPFANPFEGVDHPDKVATARKVQELERDPVGLEAELVVVLGELSDRIRSANGLPAGV